jgi:hypothetical protein
MSQPSLRRAATPGRSRVPVPPHLGHGRLESVRNGRRCGAAPVHRVQYVCGCVNSDHTDRAAISSEKNTTGPAMNDAASLRWPLQTPRAAHDQPRLGTAAGPGPDSVASGGLGQTGSRRSRPASHGRGARLGGAPPAAVRCPARRLCSATGSLPGGRVLLAPGQVVVACLGFGHQLVRRPAGRVEQAAAASRADRGIESLTPRCELLASRSFVVVGVGHCLAAACQRRPRRSRAVADCLLPADSAQRPCLNPR